jgi:tetratricopeptide (TPR) repeat protein
MSKTRYIKEKYTEACVEYQTSDNFTGLFEGKIDADFAVNYIEKIKEFYNALNNNSKIIILKGLQGTGKTSLLNLARLSLNENVYCFYYNCSEISTLDDIFFALYKDIAKSDYRKDFEHKSTLKNQSIDERIINFLKKLKIPFLFILDSFENMTGEHNEIESEEFQNFISYLSKLPFVKIIASGRVVSEETFHIDSTFISTLRIQPFEEMQCQRLLKSLSLEVSSHLNYEIYKVSKGYPFNIMLFTKVTEKTGVSPFDILKDFAAQKLGIEEYLVKKLYTLLPSSAAKRLLWYLCCIRNPLSIAALEKVAPVENLKELVNLLQENILIVNQDKELYVKDFIKNAVYELIPTNEKISIHNFFNKLYKENIPLKPSERLIGLSRASMHSEKYYHYTSSLRLEKNYQTIGMSLSKNKENQPSMPAADKIKYLSSLAVNVDYKSTKIPQKPINSVNIRKNDSTISTIDIDEENLNIQLSEEEKKLLKDFPTTEPINFENEIDEDQNVEADKSEFEELIFSAEKAELNNEHTAALDFYNQALHIAENENNNTAKAFILHKQGVNFNKLARFEDAYDHLKKSKELYIEAKDFDGLNLVNLSTGKAYSDNFKYNEAMDYFQDILKSHNNPTNSILTEALIELADIYEYKNETQKAFDYYNKGLQNSIEMNNKPNLCRIYFKLGLMNDDTSEIEKAVENYSKCIQASDNPIINNYLASAYSNLANIFEEDGETEKAIDYYKKALETDIQILNFHGQCQTLSALGNLYFNQNNKKEALKYFHKEVETAKITQDSYCIASAYLETGDLYLSLNNFENAIKSFLVAKKNIAHTISTDSKEKIERRFNSILEKIGETKYRDILDKLRKK